MGKIKCQEQDDRCTCNNISNHIKYKSSKCFTQNRQRATEWIKKQEPSIRFFQEILNYKGISRLKEKA